MSGSAIDDLTVTDDIANADLIPISKQSAGDDRAISYSNLKTSLNEDLEPDNSRPVFAKQTSTPTAGATIQVADGSDDIWLIITPAGTLATLTISFPAVANVRDGQEFLMICTQIITTLTLDENGATAIVNGPSSLAANQTMKFKYDSTTDSYYNIQAPA